MAQLSDEALVALLAQVGEATAAMSKAALALSNVAGVGASANQATGGAGAGTAGAATNAVGSASQVQLDGDIGATEAYTHNLKRTVDLFQTLDVDAIHRNRTHFDNAIVEYQTHAKSINAATLQSLANNQNQSNVANGMLIDRSWNVNATDAYETVLASKIADAVKTALKEAAKAA